MVTEVIDYVSLEDSPDKVVVTESTDNISVTEDSGNTVEVTEVVEALEVSDAVDALAVSDAVEEVKNITDAAVIIDSRIIVESEDQMPLSQEVDFVGETIIYKAWAIPNTLTSEALWKIQKIEFVGVDEDVVTRFADAGLFTQIWDDRASLTYA